MARLPVEDLKDIQGLILSGYGHLDYSTFVFLRIRRRHGARRLVDRFMPSITGAGPWNRRPDGAKDKPRVIANLAISYLGCRELGLPPETLNSFTREFVQGMAARAHLLGDFGDSAPENWTIGGTNPANQVDAVLLLYGATEEALEEWRGVHRHLIAESDGAVEVLAVEEGCRRMDPREPFGFRDGISQPLVEGVTKQEPSDQNFLIATGEFVLGYNDEYNKPPPTVGVLDGNDAKDILPPFPNLKGWRDFGRNGSYLVYRKLEQDVAGFWNYMEHNADYPRDVGREEKMHAVRMMAAKCVGRWPSGAPLTLSPINDDPGLGENNAQNNDFAYHATDELGLKCPVGAHIRRANPRDALLENTPDASWITTKRHRIIRRGIPYGQHLLAVEDTEYPNAPLGVRDDHNRRGLHFFAINANIKRQFEFVQQEWVNFARFDGLYDDKDAVVGDNDGAGRLTEPRTPIRRVVYSLPRFVTTVGGEYFFMPSLTALRYIAQGCDG
jgi:Dyp-type peroxidase family